MNVIPARTLPPRALVVAVTPLLDERSVAALVDLRGRGHDLVVLELSPEPYVEPGEVTRAMRSPFASGAFSAVSCALASSGSAVAVSTLLPETSLEEALEEVRAYRRHARLALR